MIMSHVGDTVFFPGRKLISPGHVGDTAFLLGQKKPYHHIRGTWRSSIFGALGGLAHSEHSAVFSEQYTSMTTYHIK